MSHQALNALWAELDNLHPILEVLPGYRHRKGPQYSSMCGSISSEAWSRLQSYASRVRGLTIPKKTSIHPSVWCFLTRRCAGAPLFPRLHALEAVHFSEHHIGLLLLVLSPSLRTVSVSLKSSSSTGGVTLPDVLGSILEEIALTTPQLKSLSLFADCPLEREHLLYLDRFTSMVDLGLSSFFVIDEVVLQVLSTIPTLQVMTGGVIRLGNDQALDFGDGFCALGNLTLKGTSTDLCAVLAAPSKSKLISLSLEFTDPDGQYAAVAAHLPDTVIHYASTFCTPLSPSPMAATDLIQPLLSKMPRLCDFSLIAEKCALSVSNDDLIHLGDAWPRLSRLTIRDCPTRANLQDVRRPDVSGLAELARRCRKLRTISLPELDTSKAAEPRAAPFLRHRLKQLFFQRATSAPPRALNEAAVAINIMFPHLELHEMQPQAKPLAKVDAAWAHIWNTLEVMRWGRRDYILSESGCESAVPEVPEMPSGRD